MCVIVIRIKRSRTIQQQHACKTRYVGHGNKTAIVRLSMNHQVTKERLTGIGNRKLHFRADLAGILFSLTL